MVAYFNSILSDHLSGFRKGYNCENVLLQFTEECKSALDYKKSCAAMLTDLSKAFYYLPHQLLIAKLHAYGMDKSACELMCSYFFQRLQGMKIGDARSEWKHEHK